jgi:hypothetical protein
MCSTQISPFQNLLAPSLFECFREKNAFDLQLAGPECGGHGRILEAVYAELLLLPPRRCSPLTIPHTHRPPPRQVFSH